MTQKRLFLKAISKGKANAVSGRCILMLIPRCLLVLHVPIPHISMLFEQVCC